MGMRNLKRNLSHFVPELVEIVGFATGAGAANVTGLDAPGVASIVRTGVGLHTVTLDDKWNKLCHFSFEIMDPTAPDDWDVRVLAETVATTKTLTIAIFKGGVAAEITTDEKIYLKLTLSNSARPR